MAKISIIVPVYNVEKYLSRCIESILIQTFKDIEIILVNDGSSDNSLRICEEYSRIDERIKIINQKNQGLSAARNSGIKIASGDYIGFVDSDDYIAQDMYETLYKNIVKYNADMSMCDEATIFSSGKIVYKNKSDEIIIWNKEEALFNLLENKGQFSHSACNKLYKKSLFYSISYPEGKIFEDTFIIADIILTCNKIVYQTIPKYFYELHQNTISTSNFNRKRFDQFYAYNQIKESVCKKYPKYSFSAEILLLRSGFTLIGLTYKYNKQKEYSMEIYEILEIIKKINLDRNKLNKSEKITYFLIFHCISLYGYLYKYFKKSMTGRIN